MEKEGHMAWSSRAAALLGFVHTGLSFVICHVVVHETVGTWYMSMSMNA